jgi:hypothetical protein
MSGARSTLRSSLKLALLVAGVATLAEVGFRVRARLGGAPWDARAARSEFERALAAAKQRDERGFAERESGAPAAPIAPGPASATLHPYFGFEEPAVRAARMRAFDRSRTAGFDVLVVGGSTAARLTSDDRIGLADRLATALGRAREEVRVWSEAGEQFREPQQAATLISALAQGAEPELVIAIDGRDDLVVPVENAPRGLHPLYPRADDWVRLASNPMSDTRVLDAALAARDASQRCAAWARFSLDARLAWSAALGALALDRLGSLEGAARAAEDELTRRIAAFHAGPTEHGPPFVAQPEFALRTGLEAWTQGALSMWSACDARGIRYLHVLEPCPEGIGAPAADDSERARLARSAAPSDTLRVGWPLLQARAAELAKRGVEILDASALPGGSGSAVGSSEAADRALADAISRALAAAR